MKEGIKYGFGVTIGFILAIGAIGTLGQALKRDSETETKENQSGGEVLEMGLLFFLWIFLERSERMTTQDALLISVDFPNGEDTGCSGYRKKDVKRFG